MNVIRVRGVWGLFLLTVFSLLTAFVWQAETSTVEGKTAATSEASGSGKVVLYASVGAEVTQYDVDVDAATLTKQGSVRLPANVQEACFPPSRKYLYVAWSNGGPRKSSSQNGLSAFRIDPVSGALAPDGQPASLPSRPIFATTDIPGTHVLVAYPVLVAKPNMTYDSSGGALTVNRIEQDGAIGSEVKPAAPLKVGVYPHQVRVEPSNKMVILMARGNQQGPGQPEDPGALILFSYKDGLLTNRLSIAPGGGLNYRVRHLDFHPSRPWVFVTLESQNKLHVYRILKDGTLSRNPLFVKDNSPTSDDAQPGRAISIHVHPNGKFVYIANHAGGVAGSEDKDDNIAVFAINQKTGEPTLIQNVDARGVGTRTFALDPSGKVLIAGNANQLSVRDEKGVSVIPASLAVFRVRDDGKLDFARKYDVDVGSSSMFWMGITSLP